MKFTQPQSQHQVETPNTTKQDMKKGWRSRGYLPHFDMGGLYQGITYRLADSLPGSAGVPPASSAPLSTHEKIERRKQIERELNKGYGSCLLGEKKIAKIVVDAWKHFDGKRYDLIAYVVMPNHVHLLIKTYAGFALSNVIHSWKSFTAHEINKYLKQCGRDARAPKVWQNEYFDRVIRNDKHFIQALAYIHDNPVKAGLCSQAREWPWSSAEKFFK